MRKFKSWSIPMLIMISFAMMISCGSDSNNEQTLSAEEKAIQEVNEEYNKIKSVLPGTWEAYEYFKVSALRVEGWKPISEIYWSTGHIFKSDGTYIELQNGKESYEGAYSLEKNDNYIKNPNSNRCKVILYYNPYEKDLTNINHKYRKKIWLDGNYLRLGNMVADFDDMIPSDSSTSGEESIRYKKK